MTRASRSLPALPALPALLASTLLLTTACGERDEVWDKAPSNVQAFGLTDRVIMIDDTASRAVVLTPEAEQRLGTASLALGKNVASAALAKARDRLFVLSYGDLPRRSAEDERPSLTAIDSAGARRFELSSPHGGLVADPQGRYLAIFAAAPGTSGTRSAPASFVENPNEILLVDLASPPGQVPIVPRSIRSFGGRPKNVSFTPVLNLPGGPRRLLVVETEQDITLLDLDHIHDKPERPEITVRLSGGVTAKALVPAGVVVDDGEPGRSDDSRIAVRLANDTSVVLLTLGPSAPGSPNDFLPALNLADVGGPAQDIAFVKTDGGARIAALVPSTRSAVLIEPNTGLTQKVDLPDAYSRLALITGEVGGGGGSDVALLYGATSGASGVSFWSLGRTTGQPYRSIEAVPLGTGVRALVDVPPPRGELKILESASGAGFFVLNLATRTASPLSTSAKPKLHVSADGQRLWAFPAGGSVISRIDLETLHPVSLPLDRVVSEVFDVANRSGGRSVIALDARGTSAATVLDAAAVDSVGARTYFGLLLENLP